MARNDIELDRQRGDFIEVPRGPLDRPRVLHVGMAFWGGMALVGVWLALTNGGLSVLIPLPFATMFGVALCARFPAAFFRRDHT